MITFIFNLGSTRLVSGDDNNRLSGRVEVFHNSEWGTICDDFWDDLDAQVVCRSLGYSGGVAFDRAYFGRGTGRIWLDNVSCDGDESSVFECGHSGIGINNCQHYEDASVSCTGKHHQRLTDNQF